MCGVKDNKKGKSMSENNEEKVTKKTAAQNLLPSFGLYHPNPKGNGSAMCIKLSPAKLNVAGYVQMELARQQTVGDAERKVFPTFNWKERIIVRINPVEAAEVVRCLRGMTESIRDGAGFSHKTDGRASKITLVHMVEPRPCYQLKVMSETIAGEEKEVAIYIHSAEAMALECAISSSMGRLCFGC